MLADGELGPDNKPDPTGEYPLPLRKYIPSVTGSPLFHGLIYNPDPAAVILIPLPLFLMKIVLALKWPNPSLTPLPAILSTIADPADEPTPANKPVASEGTIDFNMKLPAAPSN